MDELVLSAWTALTVLAFQLDVVTGLVLTTFLVAYLAFSLNVWAQNKKAADGEKRNSNTING